MTRDTLLKLAMPHLPVVPNLRTLVAEVQPVDGLEARYQQARARHMAPGRFRRAMLNPKRGLRVIRSHSFEFIVFMVCAGGALTEHVMLRYMALGCALLGCGLYAAYCLACLIWLERRADSAWYDTYLLRPADGLRASQEARDLLATGCARAAAWHAMVVGEGRVLRRVDVAIMQALCQSAGLARPFPTGFDLLAQQRVPYGDARPMLA